MEYVAFIIYNRVGNRSEEVIGKMFKGVSRGGRLVVGLEFS